MQPSPTQAEVLDYMEDFHRLLETSVLVLLRNDQIYVDVGVYKVAVRGPSHRPLDAHQAVLLRALEDRFRLQILRMAGILDVRSYPTDVLASPEAPFPQTNASHVQTFAAAAPEEDEAALGGHFAHLEVHYVVPRPELRTCCAHRSLVLFQRWLD